MKILGIDTSSKLCSCAILEDEKTVCSMLEKNGELDHSTTLLPMIKKMMEKHNIALKDIDLIACSRGPGSFTGVRIGIATCEAIRDSLNIPVVSIDSLEAMAYQVVREKKKIDNCKILSYVDARNNNAYFAAYRYHKGYISLYKNVEVLNMQDTLNYINLREPLYIVGDYDAERIEPLLGVISSKEQAQGKDVATHEYITTDKPLAEMVAFAALSKTKMGTTEEDDVINPEYILSPQAERLHNPDYINLTNISMLEMTKLDLEKIKFQYNNFPNYWDYATLVDDFKNSKFIVAKDENNIYGFISYKVILDELEIMNIAVRNDVRRRGVGSNLLSYVIRTNEDLVDKINLEVNVNNKDAINLYKKFGFRTYSTRPKYYKNTDDALLMTM